MSMEHLPPGFKEKTKIVRANEVCRSFGGALEFILPDRTAPFDNYLEDKIGSVSFEDDKTISLLMRSGFTEQEVVSVLDDSADTGVSNPLRLFRTVVIPVSYLVYESKETEVDAIVENLLKD